MGFHLRHGPRLYRPATPKNRWDWEVQFFRITWGTNRPLDVGAGACSFKFRINPENWCVGFTWQAPNHASRRFQVLLHILPMTFRVGFVGAWSKECRLRAGVI